MKKTAFLVILALILLMTLAACRPDPAGSYVSVSINGMTASDYLKEGGNDDAALLLQALGLTEDEFNEKLFAVTLNSDGSALVSSVLGIGGAGTWTADGNRITVKTESDTYVFTLSGHKLSGTVGKAEIVMEKKQ